mgnify:CR=1 FL=1
MNRDDINILLIDDEEMIVDELSEYLERCGYNITGMSDPRKAVKSIRSNHYEMVITDLKMPHISGMEIVKLVKNIYEDTLVLIITGYADTDSAIEAIQHGVYDFMRKPFEFKKIKSIVDRAADNIIMKKENRALNKKIKNMLNYVTTIMDISSILYQVSDFSTIINMTLDTITEGLKIKKVGILLGEESDSNYSIYKSRNLPADYRENLTISNTTRVNNKSLKLQEPTIIDTKDEKLEIDQQKYNLDEEVTRSIFIPIAFREKLFGYLLVFETKRQSLSTSDDVKLLKILAAQLAPIFLSPDINRKEDQKNFNSIEFFTKDFIEDSLEIARDTNNNVNFLKLKVVFKEGGDLQDDYEVFRSKLEKIINAEIPDSAEVLWTGFGSILIALHESTPVAAEHICANIRTRIENLYISEDDEPLLSLKYIMVTYPRDGKNYSEIMRNMENKFFNSSTGLYIENNGVKKQNNGS